MLRARNAVRVVGLDADDTLWPHEVHYQERYAELRDLLLPYGDAEAVDATLLRIERANIDLFGYGVKGFTLSAIETALELSEDTVPAATIRRILCGGRALLRHPIDPYPGVPEAVRALAAAFPLMLVTKGDLLDQHAKLAQSGLGEHFRNVEVLTNKGASDYRALLHRHGIEAPEFLMIGDSLRSDVLPVIELGGQAVHVPSAHQWAHEQVSTTGSSTIPTARSLTEAAARILAAGREEVEARA